MPDFIATDTLSTIRALVQELESTTTALNAGFDALNPETFVENLLALDEQVSRFRLLLPLCTASIQVNENGRPLSLSDLIVETRSEFDALARAQLELLIEDSSEE
jgi:hypothetical protein